MRKRRKATSGEREGSPQNSRFGTTGLLLFCLLLPSEERAQPFHLCFPRWPPVLAVDPGLEMATLPCLKSRITAMERQVVSPCVLLCSENRDPYKPCIV